MDHPDLIATLIGVAALLGITAVVLAYVRVTGWWSPALAVLRGGIQLALLSIVLTGVITDMRWVWIALAVMFLVASFTSARRIAWSWHRFLVIAGGMGAGLAVSLTIIFASGSVEFTPRYLLALGGILIGNAMTVATLTSRHLMQSIDDGWAEIEGWFALGASPRQATVHLKRRSIGEALLPGVDQAKTTGLVTLPGAFIGAIFGGLDPLEAGRFQIVVLAGIAATGAITAVIVARSLSHVTQRPQLRQQRMRAATALSEHRRSSE